jgi:hypothetical protein
MRAKWRSAKAIREINMKMARLFEDTAEKTIPPHR